MIFMPIHSTIANIYDEHSSYSYNKVDIYCLCTIYQLPF